MIIGVARRTAVVVAGDDAACETMLPGFHGPRGGALLEARNLFA